MVMESRNKTAPTNTVCKSIPDDLAEALIHSIILLSEIGWRVAPPTRKTTLITKSFKSGTAQMVMITTNPATPMAFFSKILAPRIVSATPPMAFPTPGMASDAFSSADFSHGQPPEESDPELYEKPTTAANKLLTSS